MLLRTQHFRHNSSGVEDETSDKEKLGLAHPTFTGNMPDIFDTVADATASNRRAQMSSPRLLDLGQQLRRNNPAIATGPALEDAQAAATGATPTSTKRAAVLICLFEDDGGHLRVFLTHRSSILSAHPSEVSLPGGKAEEGDAGDIGTAMREAKEEIGLDPSLVDVVAVHEPFQTKNGMTVVPVIGILVDRKAFTPALNATEVEALFDAPQG